MKDEASEDYRLAANAVGEGEEHQARETVPCEVDSA